MKRLLALFFVLAFFLLTACSGASLPQTAPAGTAAATEDFYYDLPRYPTYPEDLSPYLSFPESLVVRAKFDDPSVCTDEEVEDAVFQLMLGYATFNLEIDRKAELYDRVGMEVIASIDGEIEEDLSEPSKTVVIGKADNSLLDTVLGDAVLGKKAGEEATVEYTYPADARYTDSYAGKTVQFEIVVSEVCFPTVPPCDEEFVRGLDGFDFQTVEEFTESVRADLMEEKRNTKLSIVWNEFLKEVEILSFPEEPIDWHKKAYENEVLAAAYKYNVTLDEFIASFLNETREEYENRRTAYAEEQVRNEIIFTQLARVLEIELSEDEYQNTLANYYDFVEYDGTLEEFEAEYTKEYLIEAGRWDKALETLVEMAQPIE